MSHALTQYRMRWTPTAQAIGQYLDHNAASYYPALRHERIDVELARVRARKFANLFRFELRSSTDLYSVIVKIPLTPPPRGRFDRPVSSTAPTPAHPDAVEPYFRQEYGALKSIVDHFAGVNDPRFGVVPVLDIIPQHHAFVMEAVDQPTLDRLLGGSLGVRLRRMTRHLDEALHNAGAWLKHFHGLNCANRQSARIGSIGEFLESVETSANTIARYHGDVDVLGAGVSRIRDAALDALPTNFDLVLGHTDYAPHNIFVGPGARITVIDTLANRRMPSYRDIAYFLLRLDEIGALLPALGIPEDRSRRGNFEAAFLHGYFGTNPIPRRAIRLFEAEAVIKRWAAVIESKQRAAGIWRIAKGLRLKLREMTYGRHLQRTLRALDP